MSSSESLRDRHIVERLSSAGYVVVHDFMNPDSVLELRESLQELQVMHRMHRAGVGQGKSLVVMDEIRGDFVSWIDTEVSEGPHRQYLSRLEGLRQMVNQRLMLGLFEFEGHFACYPPGAFYRRHLDQFQNDSHRTLTCILYLNPDWQERDGGQLRLYLNGDDLSECIDILPTAGTLVTFLSSNFWHEVLPATRERMSLTGWFKTRA